MFCFFKKIAFFFYELYAIVDLLFFFFFYKLYAIVDLWTLFKNIWIYLLVQNCLIQPVL